MARNLGGYAQSYLEEGDHLVRITKQELVKSGQKGTPGREYTFQDENGATIRETFWLTDAALSRMFSFICAVAGDKEKAKNFDADSEAHHARCVGRQLFIKVRKKKENDYHEVWGWYSVNGKTVQRQGGMFPADTKKTEPPTADDLAEKYGHEASGDGEVADRDDWGGL